ncbi:MAG: HlyD family efflux transporter periplasmic adaptor subunit [Tissierellia bacterium]|nr:HlyD family efflux transporter periplasmic adaptor subunit [Tissierellia bacterium]
MKKYKLQILLAAVLISTAVYFFIFNEKEVTVNTMKAYTENITKTIQVSGVINSKDVEIIPLEPGFKVVKTYAKENELIKPNQLLAELDNSDLLISWEKAQISLEDLNTKLIDVTDDNSNLNLLENNISRIKEEYSKNLEDLNVAKEEQKKAESLYKENVISKAEYDKYVTKVNDLSSKIKIIELNLKDASDNYTESKKQKNEKKLSLERQIESLNLDIESFNNKIEDTKIYSSIGGIVTKFPIEESRKTLNGDSIIIHSIESYEMTSLVSQENAVLIKEGQKSIINVDGINTNYEGKVTYVSKTTTNDNNSIIPKVEIKIEIINPDDSLAFGYEGEAQIIINTQENALAVNNENIKKEGNKNFVFLINGETAKKVYVETGLSDGYVTSIKSGIKENDVVIVNPPVDLVDGMKVNGVE